MKRAAREARAVRDGDVRQALHCKALMDHHGDGNTLVLDELGLRHGVCRGFMDGTEWKLNLGKLNHLPWSFMESVGTWGP